MKITPLSSPVAVAIVLPERVWAGSVLLTKELLMVAGTLLAHSQDIAASAIFKVELLGNMPVQSLSGMALSPDCGLDTGAFYPVVIVPAQFAPTAQTSDNEQQISKWIVQQHQRGALIVSVNGASLLAKSGLLNGKQATGPRGEQALFAKHFPLVRFTPNVGIVVSERIICSGGIDPTVDICAYLIERYFGRMAAQKFVRHTSHAGLPTHEQFAVWSAQFKQHQDRQILQAQHILETSLVAVPTLTALAAAVHVSERSLSRRFALAVGMSLRSYVARCKLEMARLTLSNSVEPLSLVATESGYSSVSALVHAFTREFGLSPSRYRQTGRQSQRDGEKMHKQLRKDSM